MVPQFTSSPTCSASALPTFAPDLPAAVAASEHTQNGQEEDKLHGVFVELEVHWLWIENGADQVSFFSAKAWRGEDGPGREVTGSE